MTRTPAQQPTVLVPFAPLEGETIPPGVVDLLRGVHAVVLGYHELPEQTPPDQARRQFEDRAAQLVEDVAAQFREAGGSVETRLVFTHDREKSIWRVGEEVGADATLVVRPAPAVEEVYVAVDDPSHARQIARVAAAVLGPGAADVTLRIFAGTDANREAAENALDVVASTLEDAGVARARIDRAVVDRPGDAGTIAAGAEGADVVVIADPDETIAEFVLGDVEERIGARLLVPVLVVAASD